LKTLLRSISILSALVFLFSPVPAFGQAGLLISQIYGGGGNSGAQFTNDFIELYNPTGSAISTSGLSVQYASSAGTSWNTFPLPTGSIAPGHFYLIQAAAGTGTDAPLPTPDASIPAAQSFNLSATAGKVALVNSATALSGACPIPNAAVLDFIGFGTTTCFQGSGAAPAPSNTTADVRANPSCNAGNNSADFSTAAPNPRNSSVVATTPSSFCATGSANPASVIAGQPTVLTVTVTPATSPASTNIAVVGDLRLIGGSQTQAFTDNGSNTFSFTATVTTSATGSIALPITVTDAQSNSASASITLTVAQPAPVVAIHDIQGVKSTTAATVSPFVGQKVQTTGIVTAILSNGFFIQSQSPDSNPLTPEGVEVFTSSKPPATVAVGNVVTVTGTIATFPATTASHTPATEINSPTITLVSTGNPLPAPITLTAAMLTPSGGLYQLTPYEGMRVTIASMTAVSGTNGSITSANEPTETATSTGYFYAVIGNTPRPFREPGIDIRDVPIPGEPTSIAQFDDNPERILVDSTIAGGTSLEISTGAILPNVTGVLDFTFSNDSFYDPSRLILDTTYDRTQVTAGMTVQPVPLPAATEFTVASFNIERFYNTSSTDDLYYVPAGVNGFNGSSSTPILSTGQTFISEAVDITQAAYTRRLQKVSLAIRNVLNTPDIVTLEEVENQSVANDIATQINTDAGIPNLYTAYSTDNSAFYSQDGTGISVGFLVKNSTVDQLGFAQFGQNESFTPTGATNPITLNDRPWLVLNAGIKRGAAKDYPVTVIVNHMKALTGVNSTTSTSTRQKKELQAEDIAKYIQTLQAAGRHVISGGDFNAFEFSDGYTDTLATYTNTNVLPATQVVQPGVSGLVTPGLTDLALLLPPAQRWSYVDSGNAQILDHIVVTQDLVTTGAHLAYAHLDADFPLTAYNDATTPARTSDHDAAVGYFTLPAPSLSATLTPPSATFPSTIIGAHSNGQSFTLTNTGEAALAITSVTATGAYAASNNCGTSLAIGATCAINVIFTPTAVGANTGQLQVVTSASSTALTSSLTGTGAPAPDFTLADANGKTSTAIILIAGTSGNVTLVVTPNSTFTGTVTLACAASGTAPAGVTCTTPAAFTVTTSAVTQNVAFTTTSRTTTSGFSLTGNRSRWIAALTLAMAGLLMLFASRSRRLGKLTVRGAGLFAILLAICIPSTGCGNGTHTNSAGTPAGTYTYTITATSGTITHTETVALTVN
jgi:predicted extracellular nuclease